VGTGGSFCRAKWSGFDGDCSPPSMPRLRTIGAMPVLPPCAFIMHTRTAFPLSFCGLWNGDFVKFLWQSI
jgi:hypothetical protein